MIDIVMTYIDVGEQTGAMLVKKHTLQVGTRIDALNTIADLKSRGFFLDTPKKGIYLFPSAILKAEILKEKK